MAEYPRLTQSPFFRTFTDKRMGNIVRRPLTHRPSPWGQTEAQKEAHIRELKNYPLMVGLLSQPSGPGRQYTPPSSAEPAEIDPRQAAERIMQINQGLPDGVRFEPMDDEVMTAMNSIRKENPLPKTDSRPVSAAPPSAPGKPKKLPDGVRYEPLDDETMALLKKMGKDVPKPPVPAPAAPVSSIAPNLQPPPASSTEPSLQSSLPSPLESAKLLENLIQDERNSSIFYQYLSGIAPRGNFQNALQGIAKDCDRYCIQYQKILEKLYNRKYEPKNTTVNTKTDFNRGVEMAVLEEKNILESMTNLIDHLENETVSYTLQNLLNRRMIRLNWLQWAMFKSSKSLPDNFI